MVNVMNSCGENVGFWAFLAKWGGNGVFDVLLEGVSVALEGSKRWFLILRRL